MSDPYDLAETKSSAINPFDEAFQHALNADPDVLIVGEASEKAKAELEGITFAPDTVYRTVHAYSSEYIRTYLDLLALRNTHPAESEVGLSIVRLSPKNQLPARVRNLLKRPLRPTVYSLEAPIEYDISQFPHKTLKNRLG